MRVRTQAGLRVQSVWEESSQDRGLNSLQGQGQDHLGRYRKARTREREKERERERE